MNDKDAREIVEDIEANYRNSAHLIPEYAKHADAISHVLAKLDEWDELEKAATAVALPRNGLLERTNLDTWFVHGGDVYDSLLSAFGAIKGEK